MEKSRCTATSTTKVSDRPGCRIPKNRHRSTPLLRGLQFDDSALKSDGDSVGSVVRAQFREDVFDVTFDRLLGDRQLICDQFVCVSRGNQSENFDFAWGQGIIRDVIGDLRGEITRNPLLAGMYSTNRVQEFFA